MASEAPAAPPFRKTRWTAVFLIVAAAAILSAAWLVTGKRPACQVTTVTSSAGTVTTKVCGMPDVSGYIYVLAVVGVLLLPDVKTLKIGGLEFERLSSKVEDQTREISQLRQTVSTTINIGAAQGFLEEVRAAVREQKAALDDLRPLCQVTLGRAISSRSLMTSRRGSTLRR